VRGTPISCFDETWFYAPLREVGESAELPAEEAHHAFRVLRLKPGTEIVVSNGAGSAFLTRLTHLTPEGAGIEVLDRIRHDAEPPGLSLALGLLKGREVEIPVEAACEFPLSQVFLLQTDHSSEFNDQSFDRLLERLRQKSLVALKQAKKTWLTRIHPPQPLRSWREEHRAVPIALAHPGPSTLPSPLPAMLHLLVGPEGGFSNGELEYLLAQENTYRLGLGPTRLRAMHAPLAAIGNLLARSSF
jgi:16S rRNA (uracil1498-N3)-methyltransferase